MDKLAIGLWGCFFGIVVLILAGAAYAYTRSLRRIAANSAVAALASAAYASAHLFGLPIQDAQLQSTVLALVTLMVAGLLSYFLFAVLGILKSSATRRRAIGLHLLLVSAALAASPLLQAQQLFFISTTTAFLLALVGLFMSLKRAITGDRLAWAVAFAILCMQGGLLGLSVIAQDRKGTDWLVWAAAGLAATLYIGMIAVVMLARYMYLLELQKIRAYGPSYDPVTRMRSQLETAEMVDSIFKSFRAKPKPVGVVALTIANLYTLEQLYGSHAVNQALFACASRLRRAVPHHLEMGRLAADGFLVVMPNCRKTTGLIELTQTIKAALSKRLSINTSGLVEASGTEWVADIGLGVLVAFHPEAQALDAVTMARRMSQSAISYRSRIAWFDHSSGQIVELPDPRLL